MLKAGNHFNEMQTLRITDLQSNCVHDWADSLGWRAFTGEYSLTNEFSRPATFTVCNGCFPIQQFLLQKVLFCCKINEQYLPNSIYKHIAKHRLNVAKYVKVYTVALCISLHQQPDYLAKGCLFGNLAIVRPLCQNDFTVYQTLRRCSTMSALASDSKAASKLGGSHQPVYPRMMLHGDLPGNLRVIR